MSDFKTPYPDYDVLEKWDSPSWNDRTRAVVQHRLEDVPERRFLTEDEWALLEAVAARLIPQSDRETPVPIVPWIDDTLAANRGPGYRYADMPPMRDAWRQGLAGIAGEARERYGIGFRELSPDTQDALLRAIQRGETDGRHWGDLPADRFFSELLLKQIAAVYYAHPAAWSEIGFGGPASPRGYVRLGFDERDPWEAGAPHV
jgi:hypothetical protein